MEQTFDKIVDFLYLAKQGGVEFVLNGEQLQLKVAENIIVDDILLEKIKKNKGLIIDFLSSNDWKSKKVDKNYKKISSFERSTVEHIPLSFAQERLWFIDRLEGSTQYHSLIILRLKGFLNRGALSSALQAVVDRHEILRTVYYELDGKIFQRTLGCNTWSLSMIEEFALENDEAGLVNLLEKLLKEPFDLTRDHTLRASLIRIGEQEYILGVTLHHIACDGWSIPLIVREVVELYSSFKEERTTGLKPLELQYADYAVWQRNYLKGDVLERKMEYWKSKLLGVSPLELPTDYLRPVVRSYGGGSAHLKLDSSILVELRELSRQNGCSLYMTLLAGFKVLLHRYSNQEDICVGTSIANRTQRETEDLIGFFVNTLALRTKVDQAASFIELLKEVRATTMEAYECQDIPFEKVVEAVLKERDSSRTPVFQVMFVLRNTPAAPELRFDEITLSIEGREKNTSKFDLTFVLTEGLNGLHVSVEYSTDLFSSQTIEGMLVHFRELLVSIVR
ncbi:MAG: condensation domain-containing protein, partial [Pyrinomonadaceae bacterium]